MALVFGQMLQSRYRILRPLGQGGMGAVYLAEDTRLGSLCAIKESVPDPAASSPALAQMRAQFQLEARTLASLSHPNLPKVTDYFSEGANKYLVMEYVEGEDLASVLARQGGPLPEKSVLIWIDQVLDALEYLHGQRPNPVVHRDIKPSNIIRMVNGTVKLVDFGLAKLYDPAHPSTATAMKGMGTLGYAPLEQFGGMGHTDKRSDIYALGATLYHLLTGVLPADAPQRSLKPACLVAPRRLVPALSAATEVAVLKAMEVRPDQRFQSAREMRMALQESSKLGPPLPAWARIAAVVGVLLVALLVWQVARVVVQPTPTPVAVMLTRGASTTTSAPKPPTITWTPTNTPTITSTTKPTNTPTKTPRATQTNTRTALVTPSATSTTQPTSTPTETTTPAPVAITTSVAPIDGMILVYVPTGDFLMGSDGSDSYAAADEKPLHRVTMDAYWMDKTEVTKAQYQQCVVAEKCAAPSCARTWQLNHPVVCVSWQDAANYCRWVGRRLPTEAEWEKAARGPSTDSGDVRKYPWGNETPDCGRLNYWGKDGGCVGGTTVVGSYPTGASPYGALDMAGNVWEWVADWYNAGYYASSPAQNPKGPDSGLFRVLRGGSWGGSWVITQGFLRVADRLRLGSGARLADLGFRCASSP